jgi:antirestriction protein ArdC
MASAQPAPAPEKGASDKAAAYYNFAMGHLYSEMAGAFVCASLGIVPTVRHADYVGTWLEVLREDCRAVVRAASAASKAADFLLAFLPPAIDFVGEDNEEAA